MRSTFSLLFYIKKSALKSDGTAPHYGKNNPNGEIVQFRVKCSVSPNEWNPKAQRVNGNRIDIEQFRSSRYKQDFENQQEHSYFRIKKTLKENPYFLT